MCRIDTYFTLFSLAIYGRIYLYRQVIDMIYSLPYVV
jgi:hypothetical protein